MAQEQIQSIHLGDGVTVANTPLTAKVVLIGKSVNPANQSISVRAVLDKANAPLRVGQTVTVQVTQARQQVSFTVPSTALAQNAGKSYVFVRTAQGFAVQAVQILGNQGANVIIAGNLSGSEQIAVKGAGVLKANWLGLGEGE